jgi:hypothetical protein
MRTKQFVLFVALMVIGFVSYAQEKYDFMIIELSKEVKKESLTFSINGKESHTEVLDYQKNPNVWQDANPLLNKVNEYQEKGWELMNFETQYISVYNTKSYLAYLRKKR